MTRIAGYEAQTIAEAVRQAEELAATLRREAKARAEAANALTKKSAIQRHLAAADALTRRAAALEILAAVTRSKLNEPWEGCPLCCPDMRCIRLIRRVVPDMAFLLTQEEKRGAYADPGEYIAEFNRLGAATVRMQNGKAIGVKPAEFQWLYPVPPYDRWCDGTRKGQAHQ